MQTSVRLCTIELPQLAEGERYAGIAINPDTGSPSHHLILLPQQPDGRVTWDEATVWAESMGVELPTRQEAALLYANLGSLLGMGWKWTGEQACDIATFAWLQRADGYQFLSLKTQKGSVFAVRRVSIALDTFE